MDAATAANVKAAFDRARIVAIAFCATTALFAVAIAFLRESGIVRVAEPPGSQDLLRYGFFGIALVEGAAIGRFQRLLRSARPSPGVVLPPAALGERLFTLTVFALALCESVAILGLVLFFLTGEASDGWALIGLAAALFVFHFPRYERWTQWAQEMERRT